jgi:hypothetical protein
MISYLAHDKREKCAADYAHGYKGRCLLRMFTQILQSEAKNGWEHDAEEKIDHHQR